MAKPIDIAREYFPDFDNEELDGVMWSLTGFPYFFLGDDSEKCFREQLQTAKDKLAQGISINEQVDDAWDQHKTEENKKAMHILVDELLRPEDMPPFGSTYTRLNYFIKMLIMRYMRAEGCEYSRACKVLSSIDEDVYNIYKKMVESEEKDAS